MYDDFSNQTNITTPEEPVQTNMAPPVETAPASKAQKRGGRIVALALCCSLIGGVVGGGGVWLGTRAGTEEPAGESSTVLMGQRSTAALNVAYIDTSREMTAAEVYAANVNSTVGITTSVNTNYFGFQTTSAASGSGFILTSDGYILTNYHVIEDANSITVTMYDDTAYEATLIGYDEGNDIAVLKIDASELTPVVLGDSDAVNVGDSVVAIGNPLGELTFSLTAGAVSALDREITASSGIMMDLIQTDCAINSGNSGGALFNLYGEVIGITNAKYSSSSSGASIDNIGFAIPINNIRGICQSIIEKGYITKPYIGVSVSDVSTESQSYGLPKGAAVRVVNDDSPAAQASLQVNDIITAVNDNPVAGSNELVDVVGDAAVGDKLTLSVYRQGEALEITVTVGEQIQSALPTEEESQAQTQQYQNPQGGQFSFPFGNFGNGN